MMIKELRTDLKELNSIPRQISRWFESKTFKITRAIQLAKIGWNNFDWDGYYLEKLIVWKLRRMARYHWLDGVTTDNKKIALEIRKATILLRDVIEGRIEDRFYKTLNEKYPNVPYVLKGEEYSNYCKTKEGKNYSRDLLKMFDRKDKEILEARKKAYRIIAENIEKWWD